MKKINDVSSKIVATVVAENRQELIKSLKKNGVILKNPKDDTELLTAVYTAFSRSKPFKKELSDLAKKSESFSNYIDEDFFNEDGQSATTGWDKFKEGVKGIFTKERIGALVDTGMTALNTKLASASNKGAEQRAIQYEVEKTKSALAQAQLEEQKRLASQGKNKWVIPAVIGGVVVVGVIAYLMLKKK